MGYKKLNIGPRGELVIPHVTLNEE